MIIILQVNEKFSELKRDIAIGIVEKEKETRSGIGMCLCAMLLSGCILECREKPTSHCVTNKYMHLW